MRSRILCVAALVGGMWASVANAGYITANGQFEGFASWIPNDLYSNSAASQSPFTNAFANNGKGAESGSTSASYVVQALGTAIPASATGMLYMNVDFRLDADNQQFHLSTSDSTYKGLTTSVIVASGTIFGGADPGVFARSSSGFGPALFIPEVGAWYNLQLALDMTNNQYSGTVIKDTGTGYIKVADISTRAFVQETAIDRIYTDENAWLRGDNSNNVPTPGLHSIDNWVLSDAPIPAVPEPGTLALLACGLIGLLCYAWRKRR